jgi:hypothetical protein
LSDVPLAALHSFIFPQQFISQPQVFLITSLAPKNLMDGVRQIVNQIRPAFRAGMALSSPLAFAPVWYFSAVAH